MLQPHLTQFQEHLKEFETYKMHVDVYGAIILSSDYKYVLLVQACNGGYWGFPQGKVMIAVYSHS